MTDTDSTDDRNVKQAEEELDYAEDQLDKAEEEIERAEADLRGESTERRDEEDTITISKANLWQGIAGVFAVLFLLTVVLQGVGVSLGTNQGTAAAPNQQGSGGSGSGGSGGSPSQAGGSGSAPGSVGDDPVLGSSDAPVTVIKYTDLGCPFCKRWHQNTKPQIESNYVDDGDVKIVYKDAPIPQLHAGAPQAHAAANCVFDQNGDQAFYDYVDALYQNQRQFSKSTGQSATDFLVSTASDLGYDIESCLENNDYQDEISEDKSEAQAAGLRGTPHFVVKESGSDSGTPVRGAQPYRKFKQVIDSKLN